MFLGAEFLFLFNLSLKIMSTTWHFLYPHWSFYSVFFLPFGILFTHPRKLVHFWWNLKKKWKYLKLQRNCLRAWTRIKCVNSCNMTISDKTCWLKSWCPPIKTPICFLDKRPSRNKNSATWKYTGINHIPYSILITVLDHPKSKQLWEPI